MSAKDDLHYRKERPAINSWGFLLELSQLTTRGAQQYSTGQLTSHTTHHLSQLSDILVPALWMLVYLQHHRLTCICLHDTAPVLSASPLAMPTTAHAHITSQQIRVSGHEVCDQNPAKIQPTLSPGHFLIHRQPPVSPLTGKLFAVSPRVSLRTTENLRNRRAGS